MLELVRSSREGHNAPVDQLSSVVRAFVRHHAESHVQARVVNHELAALDPVHRAEVLALRREISRELHSIVEQGIDDGSFTTPSPQMAVTALLSLGVDLTRWFRDEGAWSPDEVAAFYADIARRVVDTHDPASDCAHESGLA